MEVLAKKKHGLPWMYLIFVILGAFCLIVATAMFIAFLSFMGVQGLIAALPLIMLVAVGIFLIVLGIISLLRIKRTPDCITLCGNRVDLGNGLTVDISQITRVDYREARARYSTYRWGTLTVYLENQKIDYCYYEDVQYSRDKILQLMLQSKLGI